MPLPTSKIDQALYQFATVRQIEILEAIDKHGGQRPAARALELNYGTVRDSYRQLLKRAALRGYSPEHDLTRPVAPGQMLRGASTLYRRGEVEPVLQWVKSSANADQREAIMREVIAGLCDDVPRLPPAKCPPVTNEHLATVYTLTDTHIGALCWHREGGADWDLKIAQQVLEGAFEKMIAASPDSRVGVVAQLGDALHQDSILPVTPTSANVLDADGRFTKVVQTAVAIMRRVISMALAKHEKVVVLMAEGNHDISSSIWLRTLFAALYENEPRIEVLDSPLPYYVYQHGKTMLAWHHGHLSKNDSLPLLFASQFPEIWGTTTKRYAHTGHRHHVEEKEHNGMTVMQHTTLTARDAYAARGGWLSDRAVTAVTYHDKFGKHSTVTICPEMLEPA